MELETGSEVPRQCKQDLGVLPHLCWSEKRWTVSLPAEFQWRPPGLAASRRRFLMLTPPWASAAEVTEPGTMEEGVEERRGAGGVASDGISFTNVRKSGDLQRVNNKLL